MTFLNIGWHTGENAGGRWEVKEGLIWFDGHLYGLWDGYSRAYFENALRGLKQLIEQHGYGDVVIEALFIARHVATSLFAEGDLTVEMLESATDEFGGITFEWELDGEIIKVSIQVSTYFDSYEFAITGHPEGYMRVRDIPDEYSLFGTTLNF